MFLSGGVDSSANVALMSEQMSRPVETFTVGFQRCGVSERTRVGAAHRETVWHQSSRSDHLRKGDAGFSSRSWSFIRMSRSPIRFACRFITFQSWRAIRERSWSRSAKAQTRSLAATKTTSRHLRIYENFWRHAERLPLALRRAVVEPFASGA